MNSQENLITDNAEVAQIHSVGLEHDACRISIHLQSIATFANCSQIDWRRAQSLNTSPINLSVFHAWTLLKIRSRLVV